MAEQLHTDDWLADVCRPGPNNTYFSSLPDLAVAGMTGLDLSVGQVGVGTFIMEDDTDTSLFTPGCGAYAGYYNGTYANMAAVRAYAKTQFAKTFSYTPTGDPGADAIDMEPGNVGLAAAPGFYAAKSGKNVYMYCSASWLPGLMSILVSASIPRGDVKIVSAHYIGAHICGPSTCGWPQADATQYTSSYLGRGLDATICPADFFGTLATWPVGFGDSGPLVATIQQLLNKWSPITHSLPLAVDGQFGTKTLAATKCALVYWHYGIAAVTAGKVDQSLYAHLNSPLPATGYPAPRGLKVVAAGPHSVKATWQPPAIPPGLPANVRYDLWIRQGGQVVPTYPRVGIDGTSIQEGSLNPNTNYSLALVATDINGGHSVGSQAATVNFKTAA